MSNNSNMPHVLGQLPRQRVEQTERLCAYRQIAISLSMCIYIYIYTHIHTYTHIYTHIHIHIHIYIYIDIHTYIHTYTYTYIYIHTHICIHTHIYHNHITYTTHIPGRASASWLQWKEGESCHSRPPRTPAYCSIGWISLYIYREREI